MCGIIGIIGDRSAAPLLVEGLKRLEYRGYDSAGVATLVDGQINRRRAEGKIVNLQSVMEKSPLSGKIGIGHTRWATHGLPTEQNAHPHATARVALVHNGIIENFQSLRNTLKGQGRVFESETDTEAVAHLVSSFLEEGLTPEAAVAKTLPQLEGAFALVLIFSGDEDLTAAPGAAVPWRSVMATAKCISVRMHWPLRR